MENAPEVDTQHGSDTNKLEIQAEPVVRNTESKMVYLPESKPHGQRSSLNFRDAVTLWSSAHAPGLE